MFLTHDFSHCNMRWKLYYIKFYFIRDSFPILGTGFGSGFMFQTRKFGFRVSGQVRVWVWVWGFGYEPDPKPGENWVRVSVFNPNNDFTKST